MMETILHDYASLMRRQASAVAFESLFRHSFLLQTDGAPNAMSDDMLWFVRVDPGGHPGQGAPKGIVQTSVPVVPSLDTVFVRRRIPGKALDADIDSAVEKIDWARTVGLNLVVHWKYDLVVAVVPQRKPVPGRGMIVRRHVRREVFASPSKTFFHEKGSECELDFPNIFFNVEDFEDAFGNQSLPKGHGLAVCVEAHPGLSVFRGVLTFDQISDTFERKASGMKLKHTEFVPLVGPGKKGKAEMAISIIPQDPSFRKDTLNRTVDPYHLQCCITFVSIDFVALSMALLQVTEDTYIPGPAWLYFPQEPLSSVDEEYLNGGGSSPNLTTMGTPVGSFAGTPGSFSGASPPTPSTEGNTSPTFFTSLGRKLSDVFGKRDNMDELHIMLGHRELTTLDPRHIPLQAYHRVVELNLANNNISELLFLKPYTSLRTLILDGNILTHTATFPPSQTLTTLTLNKNKISSVPMLLLSISQSYPNLTFLSLLANDGVPSYMNNHSAVEYADYRQLVISKIPKLQFLDDTTVTDDERAASAEHFGHPQSPRARAGSISPRGSLTRRESKRLTANNNAPVNTINKRENLLFRRVRRPLLDTEWAYVRQGLFEWQQTKHTQPCVGVWTDADGGVLRTVRCVAAGETLLAVPRAHCVIPSWGREKACYGCGGAGRKACPQCGENVCSARCHLLSNHGTECAFRAALRGVTDPTALQTYQVVCRLLTVIGGSAGSVLLHPAVTLQGLSHDDVIVPNSRVVLSALAKARNSNAKATNMTLCMTRALYRRVHAAVDRSSEVNGIGAFVGMGALVAHSCAPSCEWRVMPHGGVDLVALRELPELSDVSCSLVSSPTLTGAARRRLLMTYGVVGCGCYRCKSDTTQFEDDHMGMLR